MRVRAGVRARGEEEERERTGERREPRFVREPVCQKLSPGFMSEIDVQIKKRKNLTDQTRSMIDVGKKIECADFGVKPWELKEERWNKVGQKGMTLFFTMSELWSQKELSQVGRREPSRKFTNR